MLGICLKLRGVCSSCGRPLAFNALSTHFRCDECGTTNEIPLDTWSSMLGDAVGEAPKMEIGDGSESTRFTSAGQLHVTHGRLEPRCEACKTPVPIADAAARVGAGGTVPCSGCGAPISVRPMPRELRDLAPQVTHLIGEDADQIPRDEQQPTALPPAAHPQVFHCPECGGKLSVDGAARTIACTYCQSQVVLPDVLWRKLHPVRQEVLWFLCYDEEAAAQAVYEGLFDWWSAWDMAADVHGNVYAIGAMRGPEHMADTEPVVWSMSPTRKTRWVYRGLKLQDPYHGRLRVTPGGEVLVLHRYKHVLLRLSAQDGTRLGTLGEIEPAEAEAPSLDTRGARDFAVDQDGSILLYVYERLLRFDADGRWLPTWPPKSGIGGWLTRDRQRPLYSSPPDPNEAPHTDLTHRKATETPNKDMASLRNRPTVLGSTARLTIGFDGNLYVVGGDSIVAPDDDRIQWALKYDRSGRQCYRIRLAAHNFDRSFAVLGADAEGYLFLTCWASPRQRMLLRISPDGKESRPLWTDRGSSDRLDEEKALAVQPDGTLWLAGPQQRLRILDRDGNPQFTSDAARAFDQELARTFQATPRTDDW